MATTQQQTPPQWLQRLAENRERTSYLLFAIGGVVAAIPLWLILKYRAEYLGTAFSTLLLALVPAGAGFWNLLRLPGREREIDIARMLVLVVGGLSGLLLVLTSASLVYHWWDVFHGLKTLQGAESWRVWVALIVLLVGLAGMFATLQVARSEERASATLRRLVYGYNAVLTGVLLLAVLAVVNILAHVHLGKPYDWTSQSIYSLSSQSENILASLTKPTKIYAILTYGGDDQRRVQALLENCQAINPKIQVEYLSPNLNRDTVKRLGEQYKVGAREGLLVVYGSPPQEEHQFINDDALFNTRVSPMSGSADSRFFKGESELMTALNFLSEGKRKPVVYFTQGNGELDLNDGSARSLNTGLDSLKRQLEADNYTIKGLQLSALEGAPAPSPDIVSSVGVPKDAAVVVVAGPKNRLPQHAIDALKKYLEPDAKEGVTKGKLVVLFDQTLAPSKDKWVETGLEELLANYNVQVGNDRIINRSSRPLTVMALTNQSDEFVRHNPLAAAFAGQAFNLYDTRTIQPKTDIRPENNRFKAESFLFVIRPTPFWAETDLRTPLDDWLKDEKIPEIRKKISTRPLSVGVMVTEEESVLDPHQPAAKIPRLVVLGTTTPVCNAVRDLGYDLFQSILGWLRDRPADIGIKAKKQDVYIIAPNTNFNRMLFLPLFLMAFSVVGLGAAVWVVRRK